MPKLLGYSKLPMASQAELSPKSPLFDGKTKNHPAKRNIALSWSIFNNYHIANRCLANGCYINYLLYQPVRFTPQFQVMQCFNCCEYGHRAANCKRKPRCGKCAGKHNTKACGSSMQRTADLTIE